MGWKRGRKKGRDEKGENRHKEVKRRTGITLKMNVLYFILKDSNWKVWKKYIRGGTGL